MPGRPLRRARQHAIAALTDEQAQTVAAIACKSIDRTNAVAAIITGLPRDTDRAVLAQVATLPDAQARQHASELAAHNPAVARLIVRLCVQHPDVEAALGIPRAPAPRAHARARTTENPDRPVTPQLSAPTRAQTGRA